MTLVIEVSYKGMASHLLVLVIQNTIDKKIYKVRLTVLVLIQTAGDLLVSSSLVRDRTRSAMAPFVTLAQSDDILPWKIDIIDDWTSMI